LQQCLLRGIPTFWSLSRPVRISTIDLTLTNPPTRLIKCHLYEDDFGSDHRATYSEWNLRVDLSKEPGPREAYEGVDWDRIGQTVRTGMGHAAHIESKTQFERTVDKLIELTAAAVYKYTPTARACPYLK
jgi:hypothetical protein